METNEGCPLCGGSLADVSREITRHGSQVTLVECTCEQCGEVVVTPEQSRRNKVVLVTARERRVAVIMALISEGKEGFLEVTINRLNEYEARFIGRDDPETFITDTAEVEAYVTALVREVGIDKVPRYVDIVRPGVIIRRAP